MFLASATGRTAIGILPLPRRLAARTFVTVIMHPVVGWWLPWARAIPATWTMILSPCPLHQLHAASICRQRRPMRVARHLRTQSGAIHITCTRLPPLPVRTPRESPPPSFDCLPPDCVNTECFYQSTGGRAWGRVRAVKIIKWGGGILENLYRKGGQKVYLYIFLRQSLLLCAIRNFFKICTQKCVFFYYFSKWNTRRCLKSVKWLSTGEMEGAELCHCSMSQIPKKEEER